MTSGNASCLKIQAKCDIRGTLKEHQSSLSLSLSIMHRVPQGAHIMHMLIGCWGVKGCGKGLLSVQYVLCKGLCSEVNECYLFKFVCRVRVCDVRGKYECL